MRGGRDARLEAQWPEFRGPQGNATSQSDKLPLVWSEEKNVAWKTEIHGRAWSSPVVQDGQIWITTASDDGRELSAVAVDLENGKILHDLLLFRVERPQEVHPVNSYASPTPAIEPGRVYVTFGCAGTAAIDTRSGKVVWERRDLPINHYRGPGSSPILFDNLLIVHCDGIDQQYVIALDKNTGKTVWRTPRSVAFNDLGPDGKPEGDGDFRKGFATPQIVTIAGEPLLISLGSKAVYGYDPRTGKERWRLEDRSTHSPSMRPIAGHGLVFFGTGWSGHWSPSARRRRVMSPPQSCGESPAACRTTIGRARRRSHLHDQRQRHSHVPGGEDRRPCGRRGSPARIRLPAVRRGGSTFSTRMARLR